MIAHHLPVLQIVVPLTAALLAVLIRYRAVVQPMAIAATWASFAIAVRLTLRILDEGPISYALGGWVAPWGIEYRVDVVGGLMLMLVSGIGALVLSYAPASLDREIPESRRYLFHSVYLLSLTGLMGIVVTGDMFNLFVFLEISSLSSYTLIALGPDRRALTASFRYLILGTIGATFILIGVGFLYVMTGTLNMADMASQLGEVARLRTSLVALAFLSVGISLKMALFPLHVWLPNAYTYAPSVVTAFLAATATKVSIYVMIRFVFTVFGTNFPLFEHNATAILLPMALLGVFVASAVAVFQTDVKRLLAYSSVAQVGYMVLGISFASVTGLTAGIVHIFNHALIKGGLFLAMGCIMFRIGSVQLDDLRGIGWRMPWTSMAWVVGGLGLIGVPLTNGFVSKWYLLSAAIEKGWWPVAWMVLISSLIAVVYVWKVVEVAYFRSPPDDAPPAREAPLSMLVPTLLVIAATVYFGIATRVPLDLARRSAESLLAPPAPMATLAPSDAAAAAAAAAAAGAHAAEGSH